MTTNDQQQIARLEDILPELKGEDYGVVLMCHQAILEARTEYEQTTGRYLKIIHEKLMSNELAGSGAWTRYCEALGISLAVAAARIAKAEGHPYHHGILSVQVPSSSLPPAPGNQQPHSFDIKRGPSPEQPDDGEDAETAEPAGVTYRSTGRSFDPFTGMHSGRDRAKPVTYHIERDEEGHENITVDPMSFATKLRTSVDFEDPEAVREAAYAQMARPLDAVLDLLCGTTSRTLLIKEDRSRDDLKQIMEYWLNLNALLFIQDRMPPMGADVQLQRAAAVLRELTDLVADLQIGWNAAIELYLRATGPRVDGPTVDSTATVEPQDGEEPTP